MGQRRKHLLTAAAQSAVEPPGEGQAIVRALGTRGGNIVEVQYPDGATTLCMMPAKFNRKLWVRRGGFVVIEPCAEAAGDAGSRVTGTIAAVLYEEHVKALKKMTGVWPPEFAAASPLPAAAAAAGGSAAAPGELPPADEGGEGDPPSDAAAVAAGPGAEACSSDDDDDGLPPLQQINNRRVVQYELSSDEEEEDAGSSSEGAGS